MDKYCLKWSEFEANIRDSFRKLRNEQSFFDVTLATDDGHQIQAHKLILSAGSNFFSDIFKKNDHTNMLIYLRGIKHTELEHITDFLYEGETSIAHEGLNRFLETAQELKVKGLQNLSEQKKSSSEGMVREEERNHETGEKEKDYEVQEKESEYECNNVVVNQESNLDPLEEDADYLDDMDIALVKIEENNPAFNTNHEVDLQIMEIIDLNEEGLWECKVCSRTSTKKRIIQTHAETHIEGVSHVCHICSKLFGTRHNLRMHISNHHSGLFSCEICGKSGMNRLAHKNHKRRNHKTLPKQH